MKHFLSAGVRRAGPLRLSIDRLLAGALMVALTACGGGGGDSGSTGGESAAPLAMPPAIVSQPGDVAVVAPATATFSVVATNADPQGFQWRKNGAPIAGATAASYTTSATAEADSGAVYTVSVSNGAGSVISAAATLSVTSPAPAATPSDSFARCATNFPADKTLEITIEITESTDRFVSRFRSNGAAVFDGHATTEYEIVSQYESDASVVVDQKLYIDVDRATGRETSYGEVTRTTSPGSTLAQTTRQRPAYVSPPLSVGQTVSIADSGEITTQIVSNGVSSPAMTALYSNTDTVTYLGMETITVPAGTFLTCKVRTRFADKTSDQDDWILVDHGWPIKTVSGDGTRIAQKVLLDGLPLH